MALRPETRTVESIDAAYGARTLPGTIVRLIGRGPRFYVGIAALFVIKQSPVWLFPILTERAINALAHPESRNDTNLLVFGVITALAIACNIPLHTAFIGLISRTARGTERSLRLAVTRRLQQLSISFHQGTDGSRLQSKLLRDVEQIQLMTMDFLNAGTLATMNVLFAVVYTGIHEPRMLLFFAVVVPITVGVSRTFKSAMRSRNFEYRRHLESMNVQVGEMVDMLPLARAHSVEEVAYDHLAASVTEVDRHGQLLDRVNALFQSTNWVVFQLFNLSVLAAGYWLVSRGLMTVGGLVLYSALFALLVSSVNTFLNLYPTFTRGSESVRSLGDVLKSPDLEHNADKAHPARVRGEIQFKSICFKYPGNDHLAIRDFSLHLRAGSTVALVGSSGSGKSTLVNLAIGFLRPQAGQIFLDGVDMERLDMRAWRRHLSLVPQQIILFNGTIRENILFGSPEVTDEYFDRVVRLAHVEEFVERLPDQWETLIGEGGTRLSGGQKQRIAIARALVRNPRVIVLDEPTAALDLESEQLVQAALRELVRDRTTIIVAHRLSTIRDADLVCVIADGQLVETGTHDELIAADGPFSRLHSIHDGEARATKSSPIPTK